MPPMFARRVKKHKVTFRKAVAITICYLSIESGYQTVAALFGHSKARCVEVSNAILMALNSLIPRVVQLPGQEEEWQQIADGFKKISGLPHIAGAIDGSLIEILRASEHEG